MLARALFDNIAETPDELAFRRGDVLTVVEQDTSGLDGWWLCTLRGKKGIVPGNRLKVLYNSEFARYGQNQSPSPSREFSPEKDSLNQVMGHQTWNVDTPEHSPHRQLAHSDYDVPPSRYQPTIMDIHDNNSTPTQLHKTDSSSRINSNVYDVPGNYGSSEVYDIPPAQVIPVPTFDMLHSNRSSTISLKSTGSTATASSLSSNLSAGRHQRSGTSSLCGSARSSAELQGHDLYDVPPAPKGVNEPFTTSVVTEERLAADGLRGTHIAEVYDVPPRQARSFQEPDDLPTYERICDIAVTRAMQEGDTIDGECLYDIPVQSENIEDKLYDIPSSNAPVAKINVQEQRNSSGDWVQSDIYDVPQQGTKASLSVSRIDNKTGWEDNCRLSACSSDSRESDVPPVVYDRLYIDGETAVATLVKLQNDVQASVSRMMSYISQSSKELENSESDFRLACVCVRTSLQEFTDFAKGVLANSAQTEDKQLIKKIHKLVEAFQDATNTVSTHIKVVDGQKVRKSADISDDAQSKQLAQISSTLKGIPTVIRTFATIVHGNCQLLFPQACADVIAKDKDTSSDVVASPKDTAKPPPPLKPKPQVLGIRKSSIEKPHIQGRPLPAPPTPSKFGKVVTDSSSHLYSTPEGVFCEDEQSTYSVPKNIPIIGTSMFPSSEDNQDNDYENDDDDLNMDEYDYVALEKETEQKQLSNRRNNNNQASDSDNVTQNNDEVRLNDSSKGCKEWTVPQVNTGGLSPKFREKLEKLQKESEAPVHTDMTEFSAPELPNKLNNSRLHDNDKQILLFYAPQVETHLQLLVNAIDAFFQCVEYNQTPKVFIAHSKFVVLAAHKLVYIGDTLQRNIIHEDILNKVMTCATNLCECLKATVTATKHAALQYPSISASQCMVDRVVDVSHAANKLKNVIVQASNL